MAVKSFEIKVSTHGSGDIIDLTPKVAQAVRDSGVTEGTALAFVPGSTAAITTIEYEPGLLKDIPELLEKLIPSGRLITTMPPGATATASPTFAPR